MNKLTINYKTYSYCASTKPFKVSPEDFVFLVKILSCMLICLCHLICHSSSHFVLPLYQYKIQGTVVPINHVALSNNVTVMPSFISTSLAVLNAFQLAGTITEVVTGVPISKVFTIRTKNKLQAHHLRFVQQKYRCHQKNIQFVVFDFFALVP